MFKKIFVVALLLLVFPSSSYAGLTDDPRFGLTNFVNSRQNGMNSPILVGLEENNFLIIDLYGELTEVSLMCEEDIFENEKLLLDNLESDQFRKINMSDGGIKYEIFPQGSRIQLFGDVLPVDKSKIVRCDIENPKFFEGNEDVVDEVDFTIGNSGVFYISEDRFRDVYIEKDKDFVRLKFDYSENTLIKDIELSCIYDGGEDPFDKVIINGSNNVNPIVSDDVMYGRFVALGGFYGVDLYGKEFNEVFAKERNYLYKFEGLDIDVNEWFAISNGGRVSIELYLKNLEGEVNCFIDKFSAEKDGEELEYVYRIDSIYMPGNYGSFGFKDIPKYDERYNGYEYLIENGIIDGYEDGTFKPDNSINRAEVAKIVSEAFFEPNFTNKQCFNDVDGSEWYNSYLCNLKENRVIQGVGDTGRFEPERNINVVEAYKIVFESLPNVIFENNEGEWYDKYINFAEDRFIDSHKYDYDVPINRGEFAEIVYKAMLFDEYSDKYKDSVLKLSEFVDAKNFDSDWNLDVRFECSQQAFDLLKESGQNADRMKAIFNYELEDLLVLFGENVEIAVVAEYLNSYKSVYVLYQESQTYKYDYDYKYHLLGHAANSGCIDLVEGYLNELPYNARNDIYAYFGKNILHVATDNKDFKLIKYLVEEADVELGVLSNGGRHEGHYIVDDNVALSGREIDILEYLIDNGLDINTHSPLLGTFVDETPYTLAANDEIREFLLENGYKLTEVDVLID